jgi:hypothetical protein
MNNTGVEFIARRAMRFFLDEKVILPTAGERPVFYVMPRTDRLVLVVDPELVKIGKVLSPSFRHDLSTRLSGRRVVATNSKGVFLQIAYEPRKSTPLIAGELDLSAQPTPLHVPIGVTSNGPLWLALPDMDSVLVGGSRRMGKTRLLHSWIQSIIHGGFADLYLWDGKGNREFGRYGIYPCVRVSEDLRELMTEINAERARRQGILKSAMATSVAEYNGFVDSALRMNVIVLVVDEVADVDDQDKAMLSEQAGRGGADGVYPVVATTYPESDRVQAFLKANLATRLCFPVPTHTESKVILNRTGAEKLPKTKGRLLLVWDARLVEAQAYQVHPPMEGDPRISPTLSRQDARIVQLSLNEAEGKLTIPLVLEWGGMSYHQARKLLEDWEARGWVEKDVNRGNARVITPVLREIFSQTPQTPQTPQSPSNPPSNPSNPPSNPSNRTYAVDF